MYKRKKKQRRILNEQKHILEKCEKRSWEDFGKTKNDRPLKKGSFNKKLKIGKF